MDLSELAGWLFQAVGSSLEIKAHVADSRLIVPGSVFYALKGQTVDGHDYLLEAKNRGAIAAVVDFDRDLPDVGIPLLRVENVLTSLQDLAKRYVEKYSHKTIIGVTGSCGKTTTKEFVGILLGTKFRVERSPGSFNSQVTMPLTVLNLLDKADILVLEMAMSNKGQIAKHVDIAPPHLVVMTPVTYAHSAFFSNIEEIAHAKGEIFSSRRVVHAFIHHESIQYRGVRDSVKCSYELFGNEHFPEFTYPFTATHFIENAAAAIKLARYFGMSDAEIQEGLKALKTCEHRFDQKSYRGITLIDDAYNANPKTMITALLNMPKPSKTGRRIGVFGSMGELGSYEKEGHEKVGEAAVQVLDELLCIGAPCQSMVDIFIKHGKKVTLFQKYDLMKKALMESMCEGDVVLVKGSKFHKLWEIIDDCILEENRPVCSRD